MKSEIARALAQHLSRELGDDAVLELGEHTIEDVAEEISELVERLQDARSSEERKKLQAEADFLEEQAMMRVDSERVRRSADTDAALRGAIRMAIRPYLAAG
ncbi:MAG: hypothetical protein JO102_01395 [Elusimicrobia bacterium]|nr:hypothetical protein [Elusimicrobiota bacterium]